MDEESRAKAIKAEAESGVSTGRLATGVTGGVLAAWARDGSSGDMSPAMSRLMSTTVGMGGPPGGTCGPLGAAGWSSIGRGCCGAGSGPAIEMAPMCVPAGTGPAAWGAKLYMPWGMDM